MTAAAAPEDDQVDAVDDVPPGMVRRAIDPTTRLTIRELGVGSRKLQADLVSAVAPGHYLRAEAAAIVAWLLARRDDPQAALATFQRMTWGELLADGGPLDLGTELVPEDELVDDDVDEDQAVDADADQVAAEVRADPTDPRPGS